MHRQTLDLSASAVTIVMASLFVLLAGFMCIALELPEHLTVTFHYAAPVAPPPLVVSLPPLPPANPTAPAHRPAKAKPCPVVGFTDDEALEIYLMGYQEGVSDGKKKQRLPIN